jgi:hypothetical protein
MSDGITASSNHLASSGCPFAFVLGEGSRSPSGLIRSLDVSFGASPRTRRPNWSSVALPGGWKATCGATAGTGRLGPALSPDGRCPGGRVPLIITFGEPILVDRKRHTSFVAGMHDGPAITRHDGAQHGLQVDLTRLGARVLLGVPMLHLANDQVPLEEFFDNTLAERLASTAGWEKRFQLLDTVFRGRLADGPEPDPGVRWAYGLLVSTKGRARIGELVDETAWSRQRLSERFRDQIGLTRKSPPGSCASSTRSGFSLDVRSRRSPPPVGTSTRLISTGTSRVWPGALLASSL